MSLLVGQQGDPLLVWLVVMAWVHGAFCGGALSSHFASLYWAKYVLAERDKWCARGREWFESIVETEKRK